MNVLLLLAHSIEEYDQVRLLSDLGYDVFSIGAYSDPLQPSDDKRPALPNAPRHPELEALCHIQRVKHEGEPNTVVDWAKGDLHPDLIDWADVIIVHHFEHTWLVPQWDRLRRKRVIWRTVGQSVEGNERMMKPLRDEGLQIVRYSHKEEQIPGYAGADARIPFYKDPAEWTGWTGEEPVVINITQNLYQRDPYTNWSFWEAATIGLPRMPLGPGSEVIGGSGPLTLDEMQGWLRRARCYLYTGTQPASYTLGLIEAMMTGIPVMSIGPAWMTVFPYGPDLFEGHEIASNWTNDPQTARRWIDRMIGDIGWAEDTRMLAIAMFGMEQVGARWKAFLG